MPTQNKAVSLLAAVLVASAAAGAAGCGSSDTPSDTTGDTGGTEDSTTSDTARGDSGGRDSSPGDTAPGDTGADTRPGDTGTADSTKDSSGDSGATDSADTAVTDSGVDTAIDDTALADSAIDDTALADVLDDTTVADVLADTLDAPDAPTPMLACGAAPLHTLSFLISAIAATPPFENVTSSECAAGEFLPVPMVPEATGGNSKGRGVLELGAVAQYITGTASDDTAVPTHTFEFIPNDTFTAPDSFQWIANGRLFATVGGFPPGFDGKTTGTSYLQVFTSANSTAAAPCNTNGGVTFTLDSASATAHPEARVFYSTGSGWTATGPTTDGNAAVGVILTPLAGATPDYVQIVGTKAGCTVDTGVSSTGRLRVLGGFTGRLPLVANDVTFTIAPVGGP